MNPELTEEQVDKIVDVALAEDISHGDVTSETLIPADLQGKATILVKARGIVAGVEVARRVFLRVDPAINFEILIKDGTRVKRGDVVAVASGKVRSILKAERVSLNFLQRLSGIATQTARYITRIRGLDVYITDTRKTTPGLRSLEKYAVRMGGGRNHRFHLGDGVLIKDNHLASLRALGISMKEAVARARRETPPELKVEVETKTVEEALEAVSAGVDIVMLDNMDVEKMRRAVSQIKGKVLIEASGGVNLGNIRAMAETGVDFISIGALTHSSKALDISLELEPQILKLL